MICFGDSWPFEITGVVSWNIIIQMKFGKNIKVNTSLFVRTTRFEEQGSEFQFCVFIRNKILSNSAMCSLTTLGYKTSASSKRKCATF